MAHALQDIEQTLANGSRLDALNATRELLAQAMVGATERALPALAKQMQSVLQEIEALDVPEEMSTVDQLAEKRSRRRGAASSLPNSSISFK